MLLAAARHYASWNNARPRFSVHGDGSEATIIMHNTRPDDLTPLKAVSVDAGAGIDEVAGSR
eukprot:7746097-Alexandrium_andersonii.AAC.1